MTSHAHSSITHDFICCLLVKHYTRPYGWIQWISSWQYMHTLSWTSGVCRSMVGMHAYSVELFASFDNETPHSNIAWCVRGAKLEFDKTCAKCAKSRAKLSLANDESTLKLPAEDTSFCSLNIAFREASLMWAHGSMIIREPKLVPAGQWTASSSRSNRPAECQPRL